MTRPVDLTGSVRTQGGTSLVLLAGELDLHSAPHARALLRNALRSRPSAVVVDLALVSFCDAQGLGVLVAVSNELRATGATPSIRSSPPELRRLFEVTGLVDALKVEPSAAAEGILAAGLAAAARTPLNRGLLDAALKAIVVMSKVVLRGADGVSVTVPRDGQLRTVAASNDVVLTMDHDQYDTGEGPCLDAAALGLPVHSADLTAEHRWPSFVPRARSHGIGSIMSTPLMSATGPVGALNVYSRVPYTLATHEQAWATEFADQAAALLLAARFGGAAQMLDEDILDGLRSRQTVALAQGVVMARQQLGAEAAHRFLVDVSRRSSRPLLRICEDVVHTATPTQAAKAGDHDIAAC